MELSFDDKRFINDVIIALNNEMDSVAEILTQFMIGEISGTSTINEDFAQWKLDVIDSLHWRAVASAGQLVREVGVLDQSMSSLYKAMAVEFGTGNYMADSSVNPWLSEYLSSEYYHNSRDGKSIYSLPGEKVYDPDSDTWKESTAASRKPLPFFEETGSEFWTNIFGNSAVMAETYFNNAIDRAIDSIDFSKYLIVK